MLEGKEILDKLCLLAGEFSVHMRNREYYRAKHCYDTAVTVAVFLEMEEETKMELFGERGERGAVVRKGLFPEDQVIKAYGECIKRSQTREYGQYRPPGQKNSA